MRCPLSTGGTKARTIGNRVGESTKSHRPECDGPTRAARRLSRSVHARGALVPLIDRPIGPTCAAATQTPIVRRRRSPQPPLRTRPRRAVDSRCSLPSNGGRIWRLPGVDNAHVAQREPAQPRRPRSKDAHQGDHQIIRAPLPLRRSAHRASVDEACAPCRPRLRDRHRADTAAPCVPLRRARRGRPPPQTRCVGTAIALISSGYSSLTTRTRMSRITPVAAR